MAEMSVGVKDTHDDLVEAQQRLTAAITEFEGYCESNQRVELSKKWSALNHSLARLIQIYAAQLGQGTAVTEALEPCLRSAMAFRQCVSNIAEMGELTEALDYLDLLLEVVEKRQLG